MNILLPVSIKIIKIRSGVNKEVYYPEVYGLHNQQWQKTINQTIAQHTYQLIHEQTGNMPSTVEQMLGLYEIKNNQRNVLSLTLSNYTYHYHAAHGMTFIRSLTFDLKSKKVYSLPDLFKPGSDYIQRISEHIQAQIKARDIPLIHDFETIKQDQAFYIADKALVVFFQLYELTPYVFGFPMFPISVYDLQDIINENGPLGRMTENN